MTILPRWAQRFILNTETPKGPWSGSDEDGKPGPRNPWSVPPGGRKPNAKPTALDEFMKRARNVGSGGGSGGGGGFPGLPGGHNARTLWGIGTGIVVALWLVATSVHPIGPQERGVVTYFGRYQTTLEPGIGLTLPAPIADVTKVDVLNIRTEDFPDGGGENLMLTKDRSIINLAYSVRWTIDNPEDYIFQIAEQKTTVRATAESAMREVVANVTLDEALGPGRDLIAEQVRERMQSRLDDYKSGIRIQGVGIKQADPPERVNDAFKDVTAAQQDAVAARNQAQSYAQQKIALAQGEAAAFDAYYAQYKLSPEVTRRRMYYETMEAVLAKSDKTIVEVPGIAPILSLDRARKMTEPTPAAPTTTPAPAQATETVR